MSSPADAECDYPHYLYRCWTADGELLYVGVALNVNERIYHHLAMCNFGKQPNRGLQKHMARHTSEQHPTKFADRAAERAVIRAEAPLLNRQHNPARFRKVNTATYGLVSPAHPISVAAFADSPLVHAFAANLPEYPEDAA